MPYIDKPIEKTYYSIGEVAKLFGVATSLVRFWESEFDVIKPRKNKKGNRQFTQEDVKNFQLVYHLVKEKGHTLQGAKEIIKQGKNKADDKLDALSSLKRVRSFLVELKNQL